MQSHLFSAPEYQHQIHLQASCCGFEADGYWFLAMVRQKIENAMYVFSHCMFSYRIVFACSAMLPVFACSATALHFVFIT